jgi:putative endopeptidase
VLGTVNSGMGMALGQLYVAKDFPPEAKERAQVLVDNVRAALKARIERLDWMSPKPRPRPWPSGRPSCRRSATRTSGATGTG